MRDVPEESLMLTGDENIVDVDFSVLWRIKPNGVGDYLFNIQKPEGTVKAVAESAMREVVGRSNIQPILTGARQNIETGRAGSDAEDVLDNYGAGIQITQVQMQKVDPPSQVIDAFRDVQAARADLERAQNEAQTYANRVVPEARGRAAQITAGRRGLSRADGGRGQGRRPRASCRSTTSTRRRRTSPASACISRRWSGCSAAPTRSSWIRRRRSRALSAARPALAAPATPGGAADGRRPMRLNLVGGIVAAVIIVALIIAYGSLFTVYQTQQALVVRLGQPVRVVTSPD